MKSSAVIDTGGILTFPKTIPTLRENSTPSYLLAVLVIQIASSIYLEGDWSSKLIKSSAFLLLVVDLRIAAELVKRIIALKEERKHLQSRYDGSMQTLFSDVFYLSEKSKWCFVLSIPVIVGCYWMNPNLDQGLSKAHLIMAAGSIISSIFISEAIEVNNCPLNVSIKMDDLNNFGLNCGAHFAYAYVAGYLDIVLPRLRESDKNFLERISDYMEAEEVNFPVKKLFVLFPVSGRCEAVLGENDPRIEKAQPLEPVRLKLHANDRIYNSPIYKIKKNNGMWIYASVEYCGSLKTLDKISKSDYPCANFYKKYRKEIMSHAYFSLMNILKSKEVLGRFCEVIYFEDQNPNGEFVSVADVLLQRIEEIISATKKLT